jgi:ABC-type branched-subunit amino acid transport system ATPase component
MNAPRAPLLEVAELRKDFEGLMAVFDVSFDVARG